MKNKIARRSAIVIFAFFCVAIVLLTLIGLSTGAPDPSLYSVVLVMKALVILAALAALASGWKVIKTFLENHPNEEDK